jgi:hypothetical protein
MLVPGAEADKTTSEALVHDWEAAANLFYDVTAKTCLAPPKFCLTVMVGLTALTCLALFCLDMVLLTFMTPGLAMVALKRDCWVFCESIFSFPFNKINNNLCVILTLNTIILLMTIHYSKICH